MKMTSAGHVPDAVPILSRGKHRSPRKGACFMEFASYLAGEPWSDHPRCTQPTLAALARGVNDSVSDTARATLVPLIPEVVGLTGDDRSLDLWIAAHCALTALPVAAEVRQRVLALAVLKCEEELAVLEGRDPSSMRPVASLGLSDVPGAHAWALRYLTTTRGGTKASAINIATVLENAVLGISQSVCPGRDELLVGLLRSSIVHCREQLDMAAPTTQPAPRPRRTRRGRLSV